MKHTDKKTNMKKIVAIFSLSALSLAVLAGAYFLTREPDNEFIPASVKLDTATDTWEENSGTDVTNPAELPEDTIQIKGTETDQTQVLISEDDSGSTVSLSDSTARKDSEETKPKQAPEGAVFDDEGEQDNSGGAGITQPESTFGTPTESATTSPAPSFKEEHAGQVYDPVFGWITVGNTQQDIIDSSGDINKQIGTMGGS